MKSLTIDIGNSSAKVEAWIGDELIDRVSDGPLNIPMIKSFMKEFGVEGVIVSSVGPDSGEISKAIAETKACRIVDFNEEEYRKHYDFSKYEGHLGADRAAAFIGAESLATRKAKLIVDAGTALTMDIADANGRFLGGNISLGLIARMKALHLLTKRLPEISEIESRELFGHTTREAIESGATNGFYGEFLFTWRIAKTKFDLKVVVLTGGESHYLFPAVKDLNHILDPHLVGRGLNRHIQEFYSGGQN